ncbi:MAG TPA: hypothetical protein VIF82_18050, partial [Burkholderiaceae bacterium]
STLSSPQLINLKARVNANRELASVEVIGERIFLAHFHDRLYLCTHSRKQTREFVDWLEKEQFPSALAQVPAFLRVHAKLARGVYDESGMPMSKEAIAYRARQEKMIQELEDVIQGRLPQLPDVLNIDLAQITRIHENAVRGGGSDPIFIKGKVALAMRRLIACFGFERLPVTWGELNGMLDYCKYLWMASGDQFVPADLIPDWQKISRNIDLQFAPWRIPAFDAYIANDIDKLRRIHLADKTIERLGAEWQELQSCQDRCAVKASTRSL